MPPSLDPQQSKHSVDAIPASTLTRMDPRRLYSALIFLPVLYVIVRYSPPWFFSLLIGLTCLLALWEFLGFYLGVPSPFLPKLVSGAGAVLLLFFMHEGYIQALHPWLVGIVIMALTGFMYSPMAMKRLLSSWRAYVFGLLYVAFLLGHFILLRQLDHGVAFVFFVLVVTWLSDTGGFVVGLSLGRHPLAPLLSPKKTIEGLFGGIGFAVFGALISHFWFIPFFSLWECAILAVGIALIGAFGDLGESAIKRSVSIKDSGTIIPGHGGILDRVDSLLLTAPVFYYYILLTSSV